MADVSVRPARPDDADRIGQLQVDTWRIAYPGIVPQAVLDALRPQLAAEAWRDAVEQPPTPGHRVLVAIEGEDVVGFTAFGPADDLGPADPDPDGTIALTLLLVEPRWGRRGHGSRLLAAAVDLAREHGARRAVIWLPENDHISPPFFTAAGWAPDGLARALDTGAGELREIRLHTVLADAA